MVPLSPAHEWRMAMPAPGSPPPWPVGLHATRDPLTSPRRQEKRRPRAASPSGNRLSIQEQYYRSCSTSAAIRGSTEEPAWGKGWQARASWPRSPPEAPECSHALWPLKLSYSQAANLWWTHRPFPTVINVTCRKMEPHGLQKSAYNQLMQNRRFTRRGVK